MRGTVAKRLRHKIYGDNATNSESRRYSVESHSVVDRIKRIFGVKKISEHDKEVKDARRADGRISAGDLRREYQRMKRTYRNVTASEHQR